MDCPFLPFSDSEQTFWLETLREERERESSRDKTWDWLIELQCASCLTLLFLIRKWQLTSGQLPWLALGLAGGSNPTSSSHTVWEIQTSEQKNKKTNSLEEQRKVTDCCQTSALQLQLQDTSAFVSFSGSEREQGWKREKSFCQGASIYTAEGRGMKQTAGMRVSFQVDKIRLRIILFLSFCRFYHLRTLVN